jgi:hypothetical protein
LDTCTFQVRRHHLHAFFFIQGFTGSKFDIDQQFRSQNLKLHCFLHQEKFLKNPFAGSARVKRRTQTDQLKQTIQIRPIETDYTNQTNRHRLYKSDQLKQTVQIRPIETDYTNQTN